MSSGIFDSFTGGSLIGNYDDFKDTPKVDYNPPERKKRGEFFEAITENLKRKEDISQENQERRKTAKELAESYKRGSTKISPDTTVVEGYQDPGFTLQGQKGRSFGGLIGTVAGAALGGPLGVGAMQGAQLGSSIGSYF